jgi:hypothetical protein
MTTAGSGPIGEVNPRFKEQKQHRPKPGGTLALKGNCRTRAKNECQATGMHHKDCPGFGTVAHRVIPGRKNGEYHLGNMLWIWNGTTPFGSGGCHERIHQNGRQARALGLLREGKSDPWFNVGLDYAYRQGWIK